jgi:uncharacterized protein YegP (UPF0339 family)
MEGWFELHKSTNGQYFFILKAENAETLMTSEHYLERASAENGIASVQVNSTSIERFDKKVSSDGKFYFNLKAANYQVIGTSQMYASAPGRNAGIASVQTNGSTATIKDKTRR